MHWVDYSSVYTLFEQVFHHSLLRCILVRYMFKGIGAPSRRMVIDLGLVVGAISNSPPFHRTIYNSPIPRNVILLSPKRHSCRSLTYALFTQLFIQHLDSLCVPLNRGILQGGVLSTNALYKMDWLATAYSCEATHKTHRSSSHLLSSSLDHDSLRQPNFRTKKSKWHRWQTSLFNILTHYVFCYVFTENGYFF